MAGTMRRAPEGRRTRSIPLEARSLTKGVLPMSAMMLQLRRAKPGDGRGNSQRENGYGQCCSESREGQYTQLCLEVSACSALFCCCSVCLLQLRLFCSFFFFLFALFAYISGTIWAGQIPVCDWPELDSFTIAIWGIAWNREEDRKRRERGCRGEERIRGGKRMGLWEAVSSRLLLGISS